MEPNNVEEEKPRPIKLETDVKNSIRHTFEALENSNGRDSLAGEVAKSKLQVLCATISRDLGVEYSADDLNSKFKEDKKSLSCAEFVEYLEEVLLPKGSGNLDVPKLQELYWSIVRQTFFKQEDHILTEDDAYKQWLIFNILDIDETSRVHKEELGLLLAKVSHAIGKIWNPAPLNEVYGVEELTFWQYLECLEKHYLAGTTRSIFEEALEESVDFVVNEILMQGYLVKKGHMVRSVKNRWFVLKPGLLSYYTNRSCSDKKGEVVINNDTKVAAIPDNKKYRFSVTCGRSKTSYDLEARDQRTKQEWLVALQKAIESSGGQSVQSKERLQRRLERNDKRLAKLEEERKKREQENLLLAQQQELELLRQKYSDAEAQALLEAENLQEEIRRREELEKLHLELQQLLLTEKEAREAEVRARALQEELLANEKRRLEEMEEMKMEKERLLQDELKMRESLEERQKLQEKMLEEERNRLEVLEKERQSAEEAMKEANEKLEAAQEAARKAAEEAKKKAREIKTCTGLARPIGPHNPAFVTHRGIGAFCEEDFEKIKKRQKIPPSVLPKPKKPIVNGETVENTKENSLDSEESEKDNGANVPADGDVEGERESKKGQDEICEKNDDHPNELSSDVPTSNKVEKVKCNDENNVENHQNEVGAESQSKDSDIPVKLEQEMKVDDKQPNEGETTENIEKEQDTQDSEVAAQQDTRENFEKEQNTQPSEPETQGKGNNVEVDGITNEVQTNDNGNGSNVPVEITAVEESVREPHEPTKTEESDTKVDQS